jgi:hypothetical protein
MGWNAIPSLAVITGIWAVGLYGLDKVQLWREQKPAWANNKDLWQKALYRRDWYLQREEETLGEARHGVLGPVQPVGRTSSR